MSDGKGKLAEILAESIADKLNNGVGMDASFGDILDRLARIESEVFKNGATNGEEIARIELNTMRTEGKLDSYHKSDRQFLETFIVQFAKLCAAANGGGRNAPKTTPSPTESTPKELAEDAAETATPNVNTATSGTMLLNSKINRLEQNQQRLIGMVESLQKNNNQIRTSIDDSEKRAIKRNVKMERSLKRTIKSRMGKLWSMFKKILVVGLLLFFAPVLKNAFSKMGELLTTGYGKVRDFLAPVLQPFVDWFTDEFPVLTQYIKSLSEYVGGIAEDIKYIADSIRGIIEVTEEHPHLIHGIETGMIGAYLGAAFGPLGMLIGGLGGFLAGAGISALLEPRDHNTDESIVFLTDAEARKQAEGIVDAKIGAGLVKPEDRETAIQSEMQSLMDSVKTQNAEAIYKNTVKNSTNDVTATPTPITPYGTYDATQSEINKPLDDDVMKQFFPNSTPKPSEPNLEDLESSKGLGGDVEPTDDGLQASIQSFNQTNVNNYNIIITEPSLNC